MGLHQTVNSIWENSLIESIKEFKKEIINISSNKEKVSSFYTYCFSRYDDYKVITETIYVLVRFDTILFFWSPVAMILFLDKKLKVIDGNNDLIEPEHSIVKEFNNLTNIDYIGYIINSHGETYEIFTIKDKIPNENAIKLFEQQLIDTNNISISEDDLIEVSMNFLNYQIEKFNIQIENSKKTEQPVPGLDENPFANEYYDKDVILNEDKFFIGDNSISMGDNNV